MDPTASLMILARVCLGRYPSDEYLVCLPLALVTASTRSVVLGLIGSKSSFTGVSHLSLQLRS